MYLLGLRLWCKERYFKSIITIIFIGEYEMRCGSDFGPLSSVGMMLKYLVCDWMFFLFFIPMLM